MYEVRKYHFHEDWFETVHSGIVSGAVAYELATELHAGTMGLNNDEDMNAEHAGPWAVMITDEDGVDKWGECSLIRCPQVGLFQDFH